jgi:hypothetical protein
MIYLVGMLRRSSTAVIPVLASVVAIAAVAVTPIIPLAAVITALSVAVASIAVSIPRWNDRTAPKQNDEGRKNENAFHAGSPLFQDNRPDR